MSALQARQREEVLVGQDLPRPVMDKVWAFFEAVPGGIWPIEYRTDEQDRLLRLRAFGVLAFPSLVYPHKPGMAAWLNAWAADFADAEVPVVVHCGDGPAIQRTLDPLVARPGTCCWSVMTVTSCRRSGSSIWTTSTRSPRSRVTRPSAPVAGSRPSPAPSA